MTVVRTNSFELATYSAGDKNNSAIALVLPGRLDTKDYAHMRSHVDFLASKGYFALSFDPAGTWESPGSIELYTVPNYLRAINELIEYFDNRPAVLMGHSRGGTMAMLAAIYNPYVTHVIPVMSHFGPSEASAAVLESGVSISHRDLPPGTHATVEQRVFKLPLAYFDDTIAYAGMDTCTKPKLFFFGKHDDLVTPEDVRTIYEAAAEPKHIHELDCDHDYRYRPEIIAEINRVVGEFLG